MVNQRDDIPDPTAEDNELDLDPDNRREMGYVGQIVQPGDEDVDATDDVAETIATDEGFDAFEGQSAEEAAMHMIDE